MPRLSSRSKHVEFESNSALQIGNQKERRVEKAEKSSNFAEGCKNFAQCEFSHWCEIFALVRNFRIGAKFSHSANFRIGAKFSHWCEISHGDLPFDFFFCDFSHFCPSCIMGIEGIFVFFLI